VKLGKNASDICIVLYETYGEEAMKKSSVFDINGFKTASMSKLQMKKVLITIRSQGFILNSFHKAKQSSKRIM
jgi:hypothetical protein